MMTMPHLENCPHSEDSHCLACVKKDWDETQQIIDEMERELALARRALYAALKDTAAMDERMAFAAKVVSAARRFMAQPIPVAMPSEYHTLKRLLEEN